MNFNIDTLTTEQCNAYYHFMTLIDKRGNVRSDMSPCWRWIKRSFSNAGYGQLWMHRKKWNAHRYSYYIHTGFNDIPSNMYICHKCDNKECSNPEHLYLGTAKDNTRDTWERSRIVGANSKITWDDVNAIRERHSKGLKYGELKKMAEEYNIGYCTIKDIVSNKTWTISK